MIDLMKNIAGLDDSNLYISSHEVLVQAVREWRDEARRILDSEGSGSGRYVVARTATRNPMINGRTLYLTQFGMWGLDRRNAMEFDSRSEAESAMGTDAELRVEA